MDTFSTTPGQSQQHPDDVWYQYDLDCGHTWLGMVLPRAQYEDDENYLLCRTCRDNHRADPYARDFSVPAWRIITNVTEIDDVQLSNVLNGTNSVMPRDFLRIQPSVPKSRVRPFPYTKQYRP